MSTHLVQACVFTTMNGLGLALVIPCAQSLMADYYPAEQRGRAFGAMQLTMSFGSMVGSLFATNVAKYKVLPVQSCLPQDHIAACQMAATFQVLKCTGTTCVPRCVQFYPKNHSRCMLSSCQPNLSVHKTTDAAHPSCCRRYVCISLGSPASLQPVWWSVAEPTHLSIPIGEHYTNATCSLPRGAQLVAPTSQQHDHAFSCAFLSDFTLVEVV